MKAGCLILTGVILVAIMAVCVMVKFATEIQVEEKIREDFPGQGIFKFSKSMGVIALNENSSLVMSERFPYVAAITRNYSNTWTFACFASIILVKWVVTSAHCRKAGSSHRVLLYHDFVRNYTHTYPIMFWRIHEQFNSTEGTPKFDIAVAKLNMIEAHPVTMKSSIFDELPASDVEASVWKTVSTMDKRLFLTNDFDKFSVKIAHESRCYESYGVFLDDSMFCLDVSDYEDCFVHEFGPVYSGDKVLGIIALKPRECEMKLAIFTNVSYYTNWILKTTKTSLYG
ncbi:kallikrein-5-like [Pectinophora gossypiella]|uniref:kallikrein-5-like n=1 Tax=Pectinophora gossypiella TaxID=13191 RepID=UPI00214EFA74|nr:kallikrein-5-like [Pectinophora gossypiella]